MALALTLGRRGLGHTWPNPAVGAVIVKDGVIVGRGWTQPGGRPHAEVEALAPRQEGGAGRDDVCDARAVLAPGQDAALRRRHHHGRHRARRVGAGGSQSGSRRRRATSGCAPRASRSTSGSAPRKRAASMPATSRACTQGRPHVTAQARDVGRRQGRACRPQAGRDHRRGGARARVPDARAERRHPGRHRHRAVRQSAADLPAAGHGGALAGARRARRQVARCRWRPRWWRPCARRRPGSSRRARPRRSPRRSCSRRGVQGVPRRRRRTAGSISTACSKCSPGEGITRLMVEGGPTVAALRRRRSGRRGGAVALRQADRRRRHRRRSKACRSTRLTVAALHARGSEQLGADTLERYERA